MPPQQSQPVQPTPTAPQQPSPAPTPAPQQPSGHTGLILGISLIIILALLAAGAYFAWSQGLLGGFMSQAPETEEEMTPSQTETSDLEAELSQIELGADAELEAYESQL